MALNLGELFGTIGLDASNFDRALSGAQENLRGFGVAGAAIAAAAAVAIGAALSKGIVSNLDIEAGNDKLQASLGLNEAQAAKAGAATGSVFSQNFGESMEDVRGGVEAVMSSIGGMRDASQADVEDMTKRMLTLADTMGVDVARASQVAGQMITTGLAKDGTEAADLLTKSMQSVPVAVREDILDATDEYGPFFSQIGISGEKAMGILTKSSAKGMFGIDKTGDAVKEFTLLTTAAEKPTTEAFESIGLNAEDMARAMAEGGPATAKALQQTVDGLQGIKDPAARAQAAVALFGTPLEDLGTSGIPGFLDSLDSGTTGLEGFAGSSDKAMKDVASNAKSGFGGFKRQAEAGLINVVNTNIMPVVSAFANYLNNTVGPAITGIATWINANALPALQAFGSWFSQNQGTIGTIAAVIGTLLIPVFIRLAIQAGLTAAAHVTAFALMHANAIKTAAIYVATSYTMIGRFVATSAAMALNAAKVVAGWVLMGVQSLIQAGRMAAAWVIAMGPIGWVIAAVVGLVALIIANWDKVKAVTTKVWAAVTKFIGDSWTKIKAAVSIAVNAVKAAISIGFNAVKAVFTTVWNFIIGYYKTVWGLITGQSTGAADKVRSIIKNAWNLIKNITSSVWNGILGFFKQVWSNITTAINTAVSNIASFVRSGFEKVKSTITSIWNGIVDWVKGVPDRFVNNLKALTNLAATVGKWILAVKDAAVAKFGELVTWVSGLPAKIVDGLSSLGGQMITVGQNIIQGLINGVGSMVSSAVQAVKDVAGKMVDGVNSFLGIHSPSRVFASIGKWIPAGIAKGITDNADSTVEALKKVTDRITASGEKAIKKESDRLIAARRKANDKVDAFNKKAAKTREAALRAADKIEDSKAKAKAKKRAQNAYKDAKKDKLSSLTRDEADKQARKNLKSTTEAQKKANALIAAQEKKSSKIWAKGAGKGADKILAALTSSGNWRKGTSKALKDATLADFAKASEVVAGRLEKANEKLADQIKARNDLRDSIASSLSGEFSLGDTVKDADGNAKVPTIKSITEYAKATANRLRSFANRLGDLKKAGINPALIQEVAGLGSTEGAAVAKAILAGSKGEQKTLNAAYADIQSQSLRAGSNVADAMFKTGIDAQRGLIEGLTKDMSKIDKAAKDVSDRLVKQVKKALGIHSPSRVFRDQVGLMIPAGVEKGIEAGERSLNQTLAGMVTVPTLGSGYPGAQTRTSGVTVEQNITYAGETPDTAMRRANNRLLDTFTAYGIA